MQNCDIFIFLTMFILTQLLEKPMTLVDRLFLHGFVTKIEPTISLVKSTGTNLLKIDCQVRGENRMSKQAYNLPVALRREVLENVVSLKEN